MKLRNKKTGGLANMLGEQDFIRVYTDAGWADYNSLAELNEEWEDYKPAEPLINDEKIRKAVRAWAEANEYDKLWVYHDNEAISFYNEDDDDNEIIFNTMKKFGLKHLKCYTINELCGEEE